MTPLWDDKTVTRVVRLARRGQSYSDVARKLGLTRNQVAGRAWRLGIRFKGPNGPRRSPA